MEYIHHYASPLGGITLASDGSALTGLWFDGQKYFAAALSPDSEEKMLPVFAEADRWLDRYFTGSIPDFTPPLNPRGTPFRLLVWETLLAVPFGQTVTYGQLAQRLALRTGRPVSARAVGNAGLTGYAGGLERKTRLLQLERPNP